MNVAICIPHGANIPVKFSLHLKLLEVHTLVTLPDLMIHYIEIDTHVVSLARHNIVLKCNEAAVDYLFWLDDDVLPPADALVRLLAHQKQFVSGLYFAREFPHRPQIYERVGTAFQTMHSYEEGLVEVGAVGHGCCLVHKTVYDLLSNVPVATLYGRELSPWYEFLTTLGEDFYFCNRLVQIGVPVLVDTTVKCKHLVQAELGEEHFNQLKEAGVVTP